jgi:hypothetical protein
LWHIQLIKVKENKYEGSDRYTAGTRILVSHTTEKKSYRSALLHMKLLIDKSISLVLRQKCSKYCSEALETATDAVCGGEHVNSILQ